MPRPTPAQLAYGSATVVFSTLAMLLLSQTRTGVGVAVIAIAGLGLGLLVAMTAPTPRVPRAVRQRAGSRSPASPIRSAAVRLPSQRTVAGAGAASKHRVSEHSG